MVAGRSGHMKSLFTLWLVRQMGVRTLYYSADMNAWQASVRLTAGQLGITTDEVEMSLADGSFYEPPPALPLHFCFDSNPTLDDIEDELDAYVEAWGDYPELIVVDNLKNVDSQHEGEYGGQNFVLDFLHGVTRQTGAACIVLHHTQIGVSTKKPFEPQPRWAIKNNVDELPELILTVGHNEDNGLYGIAAVKCRMAKQDMAAENPIYIQADPTHCTFRERVGFW